MIMHCFRNHRHDIFPKISNNFFPTQNNNDSDLISTANNIDSSSPVAENDDIINYEKLVLKLLLFLYITLESQHFMTKKALQILISMLSDVNHLNTKFVITCQCLKH